MNDHNADALPNGAGAAAAGAGRRLMALDQTAVATRDPYRMPGSFSLPATQQEDFWQVVLDFWRMLYKRKWLIVSIDARRCSRSARSARLMITPLYSSALRMQIDRQGTRVMDSGDVNPTDRL